VKHQIDISQQATSEARSLSETALVARALLNQQVYAMSLLKALSSAAAHTSPRRVLRARV